MAEQGGRLLVVGAGGHAREVLDLVEACNRAGSTEFEVLGLLADDEPDPAALARHQLAHLGTVGDGLRAAAAGTAYLVGIGSGAVRGRVDRLARSLGLVAPVLVHPLAVVGSHTVLGEGCLLFSHTSVTTNVRLGRHVHLNRGATVGHDSVLAHYVTLHPQAVVSGGCRIGAASMLGTSSAVIELVEVGAGCTVGAGAAVVRDVADGLTVVGVPARPLTGRRRQDS